MRNETNVGATQVGLDRTSLRLARMVEAANALGLEPDSFTRIGVLKFDDTDVKEGLTRNVTQGTLGGIATDLDATGPLVEDEGVADMLADSVCQWYWTSLDGKFSSPLGTTTPRPQTRTESIKTLVAAGGGDPPGLERPGFRTCQWGGFIPRRRDPAQPHASMR
ncbi:hypothetical protein [Silvimonas sp.]|uniref:hypothetical protein n=1 Tax=Silvimonas sp. TaxID=2650811 RepID=UPI002846678F|nr:hypothetical protein [Silvimonas sp.]MDR3428779.1 hypothetical protein [Silvimonas sp.]